MWRRLILVLSIVFSTLGPASATSAAPSAAPSFPSGGIVGTGTALSCDELALHEALAVGGGLVTFNCGGPATILVQNEQTITEPTTIDGGGVITLTGGLATRLFNVAAGASLALERITLDSAAVNGQDGGAITNAGSLSLDHATIQYSQTDIGHSGGAIFTSGPVFMRDSKFLHNQAGSAGALFANGPDAQVVIEVTTFQFNHAFSTAGKGGAIWVGAGAQVSLWLSSIYSNDNEGDGGAVYNQGRLTTSETAYAGNQTTLDPSAAFRGFGGAIYSTGPLTITHDFFYLNHARFGGGVFVGGLSGPADARITRSNISGNTALYSGGGLYTSSDVATLFISDSYFEGNRAESGGALARNETTLTITSSSFGHNLATTGGGFSSAGSALSSEVEILNSTFYSNVITGTLGGAILNSGLLELTGLTVEGNTSGLANQGPSARITFSSSVLHSLGPNCEGSGPTPGSAGSNFVTDLSCALAQDNDVQGAGLDPLLGPISATLPVVTYYFVPLPGSPLINTSGYCLPQDQRHALRNGACDKGAIEFNGLFPRLYLPLLRQSP